MSISVGAPDTDDEQPPVGESLVRRTRYAGACDFSFISRLANSEEIAGHSSEDIHGRYVYLEPAIQVKAIVNLHSLF